MDYIKEFTSKLQDLDRSKNIATVFADFTTLCQCAPSQPFYRNPNIEQRYQNIICNYTKEQNQSNLRTNLDNNRTSETGIKKELEVNSSSKSIKNSPGWTRTSNPSINSRMLRH